MPDPVYVVRVTPREANPGPSGNNDGCLVFAVAEEVDGEEQQVSEIGRVGYRRLSSKWKTKSFSSARTQVRNIADEVADELNQATDRVAAARALALARREAQVRLARERIDREIEEIQARTDAAIEALVNERDRVEEDALIAQAEDPDVQAAQEQVTQLREALGAREPVQA